MLGWLAAALALAAGAADTPDAVARAFGAREAASQISLSPDGTHVAIVAPAGRGDVLQIGDLTTGDAPKVILRATGDPDRLQGCS